MTQSNPIRVVQIVPGLHYGGMERLLNQLVQALPPCGFEVHVVVVEGFGRFAKGMAEVAQLHKVPTMGRFSLLWPGELVTMFRAIRPSVVHSHAGVWFKSSRAARLAGIPVMVHTEHGRRHPDLWTDRLIDNLASRRTDAVIAVSEALAELLRTRVVHYPSRVQVIPNGVIIRAREAEGDLRALRRELEIPPSTPVIGSVGRLEPVKNYQLALAAFARLGTSFDGPPPVLVLAGDGRQRGMLEEQARSLGIASRVRFLGWRDDIEQLYQLFDLFTLTSRSEGTSVSLLEAMSAGLCPIVTDVGGNRAALGPDLSQLLVPSEDESALTEAWRRHLSDRALREQMGTVARERVKEAFSFERMVERHVALYRTLLEQHQSRDKADR